MEVQELRKRLHRLKFPKLYPRETAPSRQLRLNLPADIILPAFQAWWEHSILPGAGGWLDQNPLVMEDFNTLSWEMHDLQELMAFTDGQALTAVNYATLDTLVRNDYGGN